VDGVAQGRDDRIVSVLPDGTYDAVVVEADELDDGAVRLELVVTGRSLDGTAHDQPRARAERDEQVERTPSGEPRRRAMGDEPRGRAADDGPRRRAMGDGPRGRAADDGPRRRAMGDGPRGRAADDGPRRRAMGDEGSLAGTVVALVARGPASRVLDGLGSSTGDRATRWLGLPGTLIVRDGHPSFVPESVTASGHAGAVGGSGARREEESPYRASQPSPHKAPAGQRRTIVAVAPAARQVLDRVLEEMGLAGRVEPIVLDTTEGDEADHDERAANAEVLWRYGMRASELAAALDRLPRLRWLHTDTAGVDDLPLATLRQRGVVLTNGRGTFSLPIAEWIVLALLAAAKDVFRFVRQSDAGQWRPGGMLRCLADQHVVMLGFGAIAKEAVRLLEPFGLKVTAVVRAPRREHGVARIVHGEGWREVLADADYVVCTLPLTPATVGFVDEAAFEAMRPGAWLVNVSRGAVVDEQALITALDSGRLGGAVLDAFATEPLPEDHPLWRRSNVLVLPHHTWSHPGASERVERRFGELLRRFVDGEPLPDPVDLEAGY
jgi:phosphoglycerate dehydrogenase-like enzyme